MNRLILIRHGGSTGNEDSSLYAYNDSALCLTTDGIRQALDTAGVIALIADVLGLSDADMMTAG